MNLSNFESDVNAFKKNPMGIRKFTPGGVTTGDEGGHITVQDESATENEFEFMNLLGALPSGAKKTDASGKLPTANFYGLGAISGSQAVSTPVGAATAFGLDVIPEENPLAHSVLRRDSDEGKHSVNFQVNQSTEKRNSPTTTTPNIYLAMGANDQQHDSFYKDRRLSNNISLTQNTGRGIKKSYSNADMLSNLLNQSGEVKINVKKSFGRPAFANDIVNEEFKGEQNKQFVRRHKDKETKRRAKAGRGNKSIALDSQAWLPREADGLD